MSNEQEGPQLNNERLNALLQIRKIRVVTLTNSIKHGIGSPSENHKARKRKKRYTNQKGRLPHCM